VEVGHPAISLRRQCELIGLPRSSWYYQPARESELNLTLMRLIDELHTSTPIYGRDRILEWLRRRGYQVNHKRVRRLMQIMGVQAIYPRPRTSQKAKNHKIYPYLLKDHVTDRPNQVWSTDITYIPMPHGYMYLVAVMDWHSRYVLAWALSNTMERFFCLETLEAALAQGRPEIFNSDQGSQFTSLDFTARLEQAGVRISMDSRGRAFDNIFIERLWRTVKYEHVYLYRHETVPELFAGLTSYFHFYNHERFHQSLAYCTPAEVHFGNCSRHL
jgi:putative transposase